MLKKPVPMGTGNDQHTTIFQIAIVDRDPGSMGDRWIEPPVGNVLMLCHELIGLRVRVFTENMSCSKCVWPTTALTGGGAPYRGVPGSADCSALCLLPGTNISGGLRVAPSPRVVRLVNHGFLLWLVSYPLKRGFAWSCLALRSITSGSTRACSCWSRSSRIDW